MKLALMAFVAGVSCAASGCAIVDTQQRHWIFQPGQRTWDVGAQASQGMSDVWIDFASEQEQQSVKLHSLWLPQADADAPEFWDMRWRAGFTPWDAGRVPRHLRELVASRRPAGRVLVPGCGSGHDVRFLAECGLDVEGIDFSEAAIEAAALGKGKTPPTHDGRMSRSGAPSVRRIMYC